MPIARRLAHHPPSATHNHNAAASSLPIELLSEIFQVGLAEYPPHDLHSIKYLNVISSTCRAWRYAALGTSSLWRCITYEEKDSNCDPNLKRQTISHRTKERLSAYLSRSKGCSIILCLTFRKSSVRLQRIKKIVYPHLTRCLSITLSLLSKSDVRNFFPLPGNLYQLTTLTCITRSEYYGWYGGTIFTERGSVSLWKLILDNTCLLLDTMNAQDLEEVYLTRDYGVWPESMAFISRCRSLSTLVCHIRLDVEQPFTPVTLPTLTHIDAVYPSTLLAVRAPNLRTLILRVGMGAHDDDDDDNLILLPSWPSLTTFGVVGRYTYSDAVKSLLFSNAGIRRFILVGCGGIARLLGGDNPEGVVDTHGAMLLPSLGLLLICGYRAEHTARSLGPLLTRRPELRIEYDENNEELDPDILKAAFEETSQDDEPGVFESHAFRPRVG